jgi:hypothetical protein
MAERYFLDSGLIIEAGKSTEELQASPDFDEGTQSVADTGEPALSEGIPEGETWFYITGAGCYQTSLKRHAYLRAMQDVIGEPRWQEIEDALEEQGPLKEYLANLDFPKLKRKAQRARDKGLITQAELTALSALLP